MADPSIPGAMPMKYGAASPRRFDSCASNCVKARAIINRLPRPLGISALLQAVRSSARALTHPHTPGKTKWPPLPACHAGLLGDHRTPVGSARVFMYFSMINVTHVPLSRPLPLNTCSSLMPDWYALSFRTPLRWASSAWLLMHNWWVSPNVSGLYKSG